MTLLRQGNGSPQGAGSGNSTGDGGHESPLAKEIEELAHLLFEWPIRQAPRLALPCCIFVAALIQAGMIFLFSISYETPTEQLPSTPQIYFLPTDSPAARAIAPWLEANDPAVFSPQYDTKGAFPSPPPLTYRPSYEEPPPALHPFPPEFLEAIEPPLPPLLASVARQHAKSAKPGEIPVPTHSIATPSTVVRWQDDLAARALISPLSTAKTLVMPQAATSMAQPALYEVGVSAEGVPLHCDLLDSSGDPVTDEAGSIWIHSQRFQPTDAETWGRVLILWGAPPRTMANKENGVGSGAIPTNTP